MTLAHLSPLICLLLSRRSIRAWLVCLRAPYPTSAPWPKSELVDKGDIYGLVSIASQWQPLPSEYKMASLLVVAYITIRTQPYVSVMDTSLWLHINGKSGQWTIGDLNQNITIAIRECLSLSQEVFYPHLPFPLLPHLTDHSLTMWLCRL